MSVKITGVVPGSPAEKHGIEAGDTLISLNGHAIIDVLDFRFYETDARLCVVLESPSGVQRKINLRKPEYSELGLTFETFLMDSQRQCRNKCVFCFIDQLPKGMRESLYFKDDDSRLSFLFGNYVTLTNLTEHEIERIISMKISPVNISIHTTNPELRVKMMGNRFAGQSLELLRRFAAAGIRMNFQLVLCPGWNDGEDLERSLSDLLELHESTDSIAAVPVGLTGYRDGIAALTPYTKESASKTLQTLEQYGELSLNNTGVRRIFPADEFYLKAGRDIPDAEFYEDFAQLENGVGMLALFREQFEAAVEDAVLPSRIVKSTVITGVSAYPFLRFLLDEQQEKCHNIKYEIISIENRFFGGEITVAGLVTGQDIIEQTRGRDLGDQVLIPSSMLRSEGDLFLDGISIDELESILGVKVHVVPVDGAAFVEALTFNRRASGGNFPCF